MASKEQRGKRKLYVYFAKFAILFVTGCGFFLYLSILEEPDYSDINCQENASVPITADYMSVCADAADNFYLLMFDREERKAYVVKYGGDLEQRAWYCYPAISGVKFTVNYDTGEMQFYKIRSGRLHIYGADGILVSERFRADGEEREQYIDSPKDCMLQDGSSVIIEHECVRYALYHESEGKRKILLSNE